MITYRYY